MKRFRICAWIDTSSAATASSHTRNSGFTASARAMPMAALPAGELVRVARLVARVEAAAHEELIEVAVELLALDDAVHERRLAHDVGHPHARIERRERVLEDHLDLERLASLPARSARSHPFLGNEIVPALGSRMPATMRPSVDLPQPRFADLADHLAFLHRKRHVVHRVHHLVCRSAPSARAILPAKSSGCTTLETCSSSRIFTADRSSAPVGRCGFAVQAVRTPCAPAGIGSERRTPEAG